MGLGLIFVTDACDVDAYVCRDSLFTIGYGSRSRARCSSRGSPSSSRSSA
ncbi:hypothetical protein BC477_10220 [Clavibacter michiganensis subsp. michiganensis]|uniref:Uncharacterized protein n=1 Tax=Clavibacter michiganensis subsp. michiganensis TaxID=33013 RepID=A0A251XPI2_CLAMM|nr:hypothetical protein BC477_10220 [Clavibacter michiganensis subsp. michiganensis]OUE05103.1 hypothetical protein CMMCAS07_09140 [Clavibacter michiganensis subsp. michiganensis]